MFLTTFFRRLPKKFQHFPPKCYLSDDLLFSHRPFSCFNVLFFPWGGESVADIDTGVGQNPYISTNSQCYHYSFCPNGGPNSIANFDGGAMAGSPPPGSTTGLSLSNFSKVFKLYIYETMVKTEHNGNNGIFIDDIYANRPTFKTLCTIIVKRNVYYK